jgi:hypothetical protein
MTSQDYLQLAQKEPARLRFWKKYFYCRFAAARAVVENPPHFDQLWRDTFGTPRMYRDYLYRLRRRQIARFRKKIKK